MNLSKGRLVATVLTACALAVAGIKYGGNLFSFHKAQPKASSQIANEDYLLQFIRMLLNGHEAPYLLLNNSNTAVLLQGFYIGNEEQAERDAWFNTFGNLLTTGASNIQGKTLEEIIRERLPSQEPVLFYYESSEGIPVLLPPLESSLLNDALVDLLAGKGDECKSRAINHYLYGIGKGLFKEDVQQGFIKYLQSIATDLALGKPVEEMQRENLYRIVRYFLKVMPPVCQPVRSFEIDDKRFTERATLKIRSNNSGSYMLFGDEAPEVIEVRYNPANYTITLTYQGNAYTPTAQTLDFSRNPPLLPDTIQKAPLVDLRVYGFKHTGAGCEISLEADCEEGIHSICLMADGTIKNVVGLGDKKNMDITLEVPEYVPEYIGVITSTGYPQLMKFDPTKRSN